MSTALPAFSTVVALPCTELPKPAAGVSFVSLKRRSQSATVSNFAKRTAAARQAYSGRSAHSPDCKVNKRGQRVPLARQAISNRGLGPVTLTNAPSTELLPKLADAGHVPAEFTESFSCCKCASVGKDREMHLIDRPNGHIGWYCGCGHWVSVRERLSPQEQKVYLPKLGMRKQWLVLFHLCRGSEAEETAELCEVSLDTVRTLRKSFVNTVSAAMSELNGNLRVGGQKVECEADEIAFRCIAEIRGDEKGFL